MADLKSFLLSIAPVTERDYQQTLAYFTPLTLKKGEHFVQQGAVCRQAAFIRSGLLRSYYYNGKGEEVTYCFCAENSFSTSFKSFISQQASALSMQAVTDTELLVIGHDDLYEMYRQYPVWQEIGRIVTEQAYLDMEEYASVLNNETGKEKYHRLLSERPVVAQQASVQHIASYLGITRETLSRIRRKARP